MRRNLICHIFPVRHGQWRRTVQHLLRRWDLFNGCKVIAVATDQSCDSVRDVQVAFGNHASEIEWLHFENNPALREVVSFASMLERVESIDQNEATFCCHAKGATRNGDCCLSHPWADVMFSVCLDVWSLVECALKDKPICGAFKLYGRDAVDWIFAGSFYWIRHDATFSRNWRDVPQIWTGTENWPCTVFRREESRCLFIDNSQTPYDQQFWETMIIPSFRFWRDNLQRSGLSMREPLMCDWLKKRLDLSPRPIGRDGSAMTRQEKRSLLRTPTFRKFVSLFSIR